MISIRTLANNFIGTGLSTFGLAGAGAGKLYMKETSNFYIKNYIRLNSYIRHLEKKYKNTQILVTVVDLHAMNTLLMAFESIFLYLENYQYLLLFI